MTLLVDNTFSDHLLVIDITANALDIIPTLHLHPLAQHPITQWAHDLVNRSFARSLRDLSRIDNGWHFSAVNASVQQINDFRIEDMARHLHSTSSSPLEHGIQSLVLLLLLLLLSRFPLRI